VQEHLHPERFVDLATGLKHSVDLGQFYLKERRLDDADRFFKELETPGKKSYAYHLLSQIGHAAVLAYKDQPQESNKIFVEIAKDITQIETKPNAKELKAIVRKDGQRLEKLDAYRLLWKDNAQVREMVARALVQNKENAPGSFPEALEMYLSPPAAKIRTAQP
jgi:hypothetical protein